MTDNTAESEVTQRKVAKDESDIKKEDEEDNKSEEVKDESETKEKLAKPKTREDFDATWKYYWYMFRYYHFKIADTIDLYASAACLWFINLYLRLFMGIGPEPQSALTEDE